jgi:hypothetical protein
MAEEVKLHGRVDESLNYPIRVVEAEPYLRPGTGMGSEGNFKVVYRELGTLPSERLRLPVPSAMRRLDGRVGRVKTGTLYAGFFCGDSGRERTGGYLYASTDEGRSWTGKEIDGYNPEMAQGEPGRNAQVLLRSNDQGKTWGAPGLIEEHAAETGLLALGGKCVLILFVETVRQRRSAS